MNHKVQLVTTGRKFDVTEGESILDAALRQGLAFPYGCRNGVCGSCKGHICSGSVDYGAASPQALTENEKKNGIALFCQARPLSDLIVDINEISDAEEIRILKLPCRVEKMERLTKDVMRLYLKMPSAKRMQFLAGQYIDFILDDGRHRSFSIANPPHDDDLIELHIRHVEHGHFTDYIFNELKEKSILRIEGPYGNFYFREDSTRPIILMAGGTGFAPIKAIIEHALSEGVSRPMHLYWGVRSKADLYLDKLARHWAEKSNFTYRPVLSDPLVSDNWHGRSGFVHQAVVEDFPRLGAYDIYASGPPVMINAGKKAFLAHGLPEEHLYYDSFEFAADSRRA